jgi:hypothetical protein
MQNVPRLQHVNPNDDLLKIQEDLLQPVLAIHQLLPQILLAEL